MVTDVKDLETQQEERLLEFGRRASTRVPKRRSLLFQGPLRAIRLCLLCILIPGLLISVPLYLRYHVYYKQEYALSMSDMRMINAHVSTTWCQKQEVRVNTTFNAYVVDGTPSVVKEPTRVSMDRHLVLEDDMKEYWAFYLLKGSSVTVTTCVRWQGASLIIIKGHKHLRECAYIGDNSSEEEDELDDDRHDSSAADETDANNTNVPQRMRRLRAGVVLHGLQPPLSSKEKLKKDPLAFSEEENKLAKLVLRKANKQPKPSLIQTESIPAKTTPEVLSNNTESHVVKPEPTSSEIFEELLMKIKLLGPRGKSVLDKLYQQLVDEGNTELQIKVMLLLGKEEDDVKKKNLDVLANKPEATLSHEKEDSDSQLVKKIEVTPSQDVTVNDDDDESVDVTLSPDMGDVTVANGNIGDELVKVNGDGVKTSPASRRRREIQLGSAKLLEIFNKHDIDDDVGIEEDLAPDGIADHHRTLNETTAGDHSNSEFWSSFSSSEEALLQCAGLILNLPLTPHRHCEKHRSLEVHARAALPNTITYKVASTGYYFFVFSSENEIQPNYFSVHFNLEKTMYDVSKPVHSCKNATESCTLPLSFWSSDTVVVELPVGHNESAWNEDFVAESTCEPRTAIFLVCVISVPLVILSFAFH